MTPISDCGLRAPEGFKLKPGVLTAASWSLRNVRALDPASGTDQVRDVFCRDGAFDDAPAPGAPDIECSGKLVAMPPAIDLHVHFREPGGESAETVASGLAAAARGGVGTVVTMPNTTPPVDSPEALRHQAALAAAATERRVVALHSACCTVGRAGGVAAPIEALASAGAVAFTDDGASVEPEAALEEVMRRAAALNVPVMDHAVAASVAAGGVVRQCAAARAAGLAIFPDEAELQAVRRDIAVAARTGARLHLQHLSAEESPALVAAASARGVCVSAEATPHHLLFCADDIPDEAPAVWKMNPPLPSREGRAALRRAVLDGTVSCFATDHAPHAASAKARGFATAPFGVIGLETALPASWLAMVEQAGMSPLEWTRRWTTGPASVIGLPPPTLAAGSPAAVTLLQPCEWIPAVDDLASKSSNCPFLGLRFPVRVLALLRPVDSV